MGGELDQQIYAGKGLRVGWIGVEKRVSPLLFDVPRVESPAGRNDGFLGADNQFFIRSHTSLYVALVRSIVPPLPSSEGIRMRRSLPWNSNQRTLLISALVG